MRILIGIPGPGRVNQQMEITDNEYRLLADTTDGLASVLVLDQLTGRAFRLRMKITDGIASIEHWDPAHDSIRQHQIENIQTESELFKAQFYGSWDVLR